MEETYVKTGAGGKYVFQAVDKHGRLIDFMLANHRNIRSAHDSWTSIGDHASLAALFDHY